MAAQKGSAILLKRELPATPGTFAAIAGLRTKSIELNAETVDVTNSDSVGKWRELLEGAGVKSASIAGAGVFKDDVTDEGVRADFMAGTLRKYQFLVPGLGTFEGLYQVTKITYAGEHNGEATFDLAFESAGEITFAAAA
jgi:TP901-1 family phage major tail protein